MLLPLSGEQKGTLSRLAKKACERAQQHDLIDNNESFEDWRTRGAIDCCGNRISKATNANFT